VNNLFGARATLNFFTHSPKLNLQFNIPLAAADIKYLLFSILSTFITDAFGFMFPRISVLIFSTRFVHSYWASRRNCGCFCRTWRRTAVFIIPCNIFHMKDSFIFFFQLASTVLTGPWSFLMDFSIHRHLIGLLGWGISPTKGLYLHTGQDNTNTQTHIPAPSRIRTCDLNVQAVVDSTCLRPVVFNLFSPRTPKRHFSTQLCTPKVVGA
jgi:hypothetical protein